MKSRDAFSDYHPLVNFVYFALVLAFTMFFLHPVSLVFSLAGAAAYSAILNGRKALRSQLRFLLPMTLMAAVLNPAFNHRGVTILAYFPWGNPLTLESVLYGLAAAVMLAAALLWFSCCSAVMTSDKFLYLFGRVIPALSLVLSMTLRFVPRFKAQFKAAADAQRCVGRSVSEGPLLQRLRNAVTILSIVVTWALENAIGTADSMRSRGYGLPGRTAFSLYRFDGRDRAALLWLSFCGFFVVSGWIAGGFAWRWYPAVSAPPLTPLTASFQLVYLALCFTPVIFHGWEDRKWKHLPYGS